MANFKYTAREIYEIDFGVKMRGYDKDQVDEMLDNVIIDYETYAAELLKLQEENEFLKNRVGELEKSRSTVSTPEVVDLDQTQRFETATSVDLPFPNSANMRRTTINVTPQNGIMTQNPMMAQTREPSNFELIKRINRLERAVFGADSQYSNNNNHSNK